MQFVDLLGALLIHNDLRMLVMAVSVPDHLRKGQGCEKTTWVEVKGDVQTELNTTHCE